MFSRSTMAFLRASRHAEPPKQVTITYPAKLPTQRAFWENLNGGALSSISPLLMFTLWHMQAPELKKVLHTGKGSLYAAPLMEQYFSRAAPEVRKQFYDSHAQVQKAILTAPTLRRRTGYHIFISGEGAKPIYAGLSWKAATMKLARAWRSLSEQKRAQFTRDAAATRIKAKAPAKAAVSKQ